MGTPKRCATTGTDEVEDLTQSDRNNMHDEPNKKPRLAETETATRISCLDTIPDPIISIILSYGTSVDMARLLQTSSTLHKSYSPTIESIASKAIEAERKHIKWCQLLYTQHSPRKCFEYSTKEGPKLKRLHQLEKATMESYHFSNLTEASHFLRREQHLQGRDTLAELYCPQEQNCLMHDYLGGLVQCVGGRSSDKIKYLQTRRAVSLSTEEKHRFVVKITWRDDESESRVRDPVFLGVVDERYEPPYTRRKPYKFTKSNNGIFTQLPIAKKEQGEESVVVGATMDTSSKELVLHYFDDNKEVVTKMHFSFLRGDAEVRLAFWQLKERLFGVLDIAMREIGEEAYGALMAEERAVKMIATTTSEG